MQVRLFMGLSFICLFVCFLIYDFNQNKLCLYVKFHQSSLLRQSLVCWVICCFTYFAPQSHRFFRDPEKANSLNNSLYLCLCVLLSLLWCNTTAHQKTIVIKASEHVFHCALCPQWWVIVKSFGFALFHQTQNCADGSLFFSDLPFTCL